MSFRARGERVWRLSGAPVRWLISCVLITSVVAASPAPNASANTSLQTFVSMLSDPDVGDYVGGYRTLYYYPDNAIIGISGNAEWLTVQVKVLGPDGYYDNWEDEYYNLEFAAPRGERLHTGLYLGAERAAFREGRRPGIDIGGDGRGCNETFGRFDVKDIAVNSKGTVTRLWLTYEQHCEYSVESALIGEVRYRVPGPESDLLPIPGRLWWPDVEVGVSGLSFGATFVATGSGNVTIDNTSVVGRNPADFVVRGNECSGVTLAPGQACQVLLRFAPQAAGPRVATLLASDTNGRRYEVALDGYSPHTRSRWDVHWDPSSFRPIAGDWHFSRPNGDRMMANWDREGLPGAYRRYYVEFGVSGTNQSGFHATFYAPYPDKFEVGRTYRMTDSSSAEMDLYPESCTTVRATFTFRSLSLRWAHVVQRALVDFEWYCDGEPTPILGTIEYQMPYGDVMRPGAVTNLRVRRSGGNATVTWTNPTNGDYAFTIGRYLHGRTAPGAPNAGFFGFADRASRATLTGLSARRPLAVAVYAVDTTGNVSSRTVKVVDPVP